MTGSVKQDILALLGEQEAAVARGDAKGVVAPMADDIISYDLPPPLEYGGAGASALEGYEQWFATWSGPVTTELIDPTIMVDGDLAVVFGLSRMRGTKSDGTVIDSWNRRTAVLRRHAGAWAIVHEHSSYPLAMDGSGRALTDLKPGS